VHGGPRLWQIVKTGSSFASQSEMPVTFGLGRATAVDSIRVTWPSGRVDTVAGVQGDQAITIKEGAGAVKTESIVRTARQSAAARR
jgi:hypothetical protein